ncbi:glycosyltransferase family 4 protein [Deinococcus arcticus]|nr:glycosyltransferase [Deinococcus arcticus]
MRLVFWQQFYSPHQYALLNALSHHAQVQTVDLVLDQDVSQERQNMHWAALPYEHLTVHRHPDLAQIELLVQQAGTVHVFSGLHLDPTSSTGLRRCTQLGRPVAMMAEAGDWHGHGLKRYPRLALHMWRRLRYGRHLCQILAIGELGVRWYRRVGYPSKCLTPFAYFVAPERLPNATAPAVPEILFVGRALAYKGGELLLQALSHLKDQTWHATLITQGPEREAWERCSRVLGLHDRVTFTDFKPPEQVLRHMADASMLVLPNIADEGWGAVVNEALFQGTPVLCTTLTGASDMVRGVTERGQVTEPTEEALVLALRRQLERGHPSMNDRAQIIKGVKEQWSGESGANRLVQALSPCLHKRGT